MRGKTSPTLGVGSCKNVAATSSNSGKIRAGAILGLLCFLVYMANFRLIGAGDTYPARFLPFVILRWHTVLLDPIADIAAQGEIPIKPRKDKGSPTRVDPQEAFWIVQLPNGQAVSLYPVVVPLLVCPLYLPAVAYLDAKGWDSQRLDRIARVMEKVSASLLAAIGVVFFYLLLRRRVNPGAALLLTSAYAFGTTTWMIGSQALWQHGAAQLLVVCALLLLTGQCTRGRVLAAGVVLGLIACNRPPDALIAAVLGVYGFLWARKFVPVLVAGTLLPIIPLFVYNIGIVGHIAGAYGLVGDSSFFQHNLLSGIAGLLFSPTRGLFVFSPFLIFVPLCVPSILRNEKTRGIGVAILCAVFLQLLVYGMADWRQGGCWGPRWLTDLLPLLVWVLTPIATDFGKATRATFAFAAGAAIAIEAIGAFWYTGASDRAVYASAAESNPMRSAWELRNAPFIAELRHERAPFDLAADVQGYVDAVKTIYGPEGREISIDGWALVDKHSPAEVVVLRDGRPAASTTVFGPRPDVSSALGAKGPSGWHVSVPASGLSGGSHVLAVLVRAYPGSGVRWLAERHVEVPSGSGLAFSARLAADILSSRQQQHGYWLTSHTSQPRFEQPGAEMNTYLPSVMVDILGPVADASGLRPNLLRARDFLTSQIEANGLVRYHGLPDAPTIGTLGCAITPDADDTALVWRIAPAAHTGLRVDALRMMTAFRTPDGLYRTWLASPDRYRCIDPGVDPNPADIAIQIHVLLLLAEADPPAARALCAALKQSVDDDRIWVYYKRAPLIPILRQADLRETGCSLRLPASRQQTTVPGQELWLSAVLMLDRARNAGGPPLDPGEVRKWLEKVSKDEFSLARSTPPLLYHNDLSASVSRYYWSEEFGYVLWLRLYFELARLPTNDSK
jgi:hypothetical protein